MNYWQVRLGKPIASAGSAKVERRSDFMRRRLPSRVYCAEAHRPGRDRGPLNTTRHDRVM
jgi:hypothetical protein